VVALDGRSGAGKTCLADAVAARLPDAAVVHLDDLYPGWDGLEAVVPLLVDHVLRALDAGGPVAVPSWTWSTGEPGPPRVLPALGPPRPVIVLLEGAGAGARAVAPYLAGLVWLEAAEPIRRERALARDGDVFGTHWSRWARQEAGHFVREGSRARADLVLDSTDDLRYPVVVLDSGR
jgi:uridine kinase